MNLDKISKIIWLMIGIVFLIGILMVVGSIVWGIVNTKRFQPEGIQVEPAKDAEEGGHVLRTVYEMPLLTEGSEFIVVPVSLKKVAQDEDRGSYLLSSKRVSSKGSWSYARVDFINYNYFDGPCHNLVFINKKSGQAEKLLNERAYIGAVYFPVKKSLPEEKPQPAFILLKMGKHDTNGDNTINDKDALAGYLVGLDGKGLTQITPPDTDMTSWRYDKDNKKIFVNIIEDTNKDKKYTEEDQEKILVVGEESPGMGQELISEAIKKEIEEVIR